MKRVLQLIVFAVLAMVMVREFMYAGVIADSVADFSDTQGKGNWSYGEWYNPATGANMDDYNYNLYQDLPYYNLSAVWEFSAWMRSAEGAGWHPFLSSEQTQPRVANEHIGPTNGWPVRRWTSNYTGTVNISGLVQRLEGTGGDGMRVIIMKNAATSTTDDTLHNVIYAHDDNVEHSYSITVPVTVNDKIDFIVDPIGSLDHDRTKYTAVISTMPESPAPESSTLPPQVQARLKEERTQLDEVKSLLSVNPQVAGDDYIQLGVAIAERFIRRVETGGPDGKQSLDWSLLQINEVKEVLSQTEDRIQRMVAEELSPQLVPRPTGGPVTVRDGIFYSDTTIGEGSPAVQRPYYLGGYGVFGQVAADIPNFNNLGVTLVSQERGPSSMNSDGSLNANGLSILNTLKSAARNGIKVDLLLSPHYFPQWAIDQAPDMAPTPYSILLEDWKDYVGFPNFHIDHPKAREVIQKWLEAIVSAAKDEPALFSLCLANEANNVNGGRDPYSLPRWIEYLKQQHRTIASLNALYGTNYGSFEEVPVPPKSPQDEVTQMPAEIGARRAYYDWARFNQCHFADWFRWMNNLIKRLTPDMPTHIKVLSSFFFFRHLSLGNDPELLSRVTDLAGNDAVAVLATPGSSYAYDWQTGAIWYDLLHSFRGQPVFNSENHFIVDGSPAVSLPPNHIRSVLWQGALHHQGATTLWVWEEPVLPQLDGSIYLRPANIYAAGQTMLDINRLAPEVAAISQAKPKVALLYSMPSWVWQEDYVEVMKKVYTALLYIGQPVTFVSEQQLAEGSAAKVDWIIFSHATHVQDATSEALEKFVAEGGRVAMVGKDCLRWDEYHRQRKLPKRLSTAPQIDATTDDEQVMTNLRPVLVDGGLKLTTLRNAGDGKLAWGVEYRVVPYQGGVLVPVINFLQQSQSVQLSLSRQDKSGLITDLLSHEAVNPDQISLKPMCPRLLWVP